LYPSAKTFEEKADSLFDRANEQWRCQALSAEAYEPDIKQVPQNKEVIKEGNSTMVLCQTIPLQPKIIQTVNHVTTSSI
jgi:hypothetical protein